MQRVTLIGSAIGAALTRGVGAILSVPDAIHRVATGAKRARQMISVKTRHSRSKYMPHIGAKEQARAKRCYMSSTFNCSGNPRATPVMHQFGKCHASCGAL
ncbi:hypothetical protein PQQ77_25035 [Paraburkholderia strydomiana]|uniref:hypothetical protein n=1 Tax=Paraburkholderia strydomiana TaxID=1245417 RepID=UPI0038BAE839